MGRRKRLKQRFKVWRGDCIDFSFLNMKDYLYIKSTYFKRPNSALISRNNLERIQKINPVFLKREPIYNKAIRFLNYYKLRESNIYDSFLLRIYCSAFDIGYKDIDQKIKESIYQFVLLSAQDCQTIINLYVKDLDDVKDFPTLKTKGWFEFIDFLVDLGKREGSVVRGILYEKEMLEAKEQVKKRSNNIIGDKKKLSLILSEAIVVQPEDIMQRIETFLKDKKTKHDLACLKIALDELLYISTCNIKEFRDALFLEYGESISIINERGIQDAHKTLISFIGGQEGKLVKDYVVNRLFIDEIKKILSK